MDLLSRGCGGSPHLAVEEAEKKKLAKYTEISKSNFIFQLVAFDTQGNYGTETSIFLDEMLKRVTSTAFEKRARSFLFKSFDPPPTTQLGLQPRNFK